MEALMTIQSRFSRFCYSLIPALVAALAAGLSSVPTLAADTIRGQVLGGGTPIIGSTVTLWAASAATPKQLAQTLTGSDGRFQLNADTNGAMLYLVAKGGHPIANTAGEDNPAIALITVLGNAKPANVVINEMTTVASIWTN